VNECVRGWRREVLVSTFIPRSAIVCQCARVSLTIIRNAFLFNDDYDYDRIYTVIRIFYDRFTIPSLFSYFDFLFLTIFFTIFPSIDSSLSRFIRSLCRCCFVHLDQVQGARPYGVCVVCECMGRVLRLNTEYTSLASVMSF